jgi:hypothetical protein
MVNQTNTKLIIDESQYKENCCRSCYHIKDHMIYLRKWRQDGDRLYLGIYSHPMLEQYRFTRPIFVDDNNLVYVLAGAHEWCGQGDLVTSGSSKIIENN